jgi:hypothetical protein
MTIGGTEPWNDSERLPKVGAMCRALLPVKQAGVGKARIGFDFAVAFAFDRSTFVVRPYKFGIGGNGPPAQD